MKLPTLSPDGLVKCEPIDFREAIKYSIMQRIDNIEEKCDIPVFLAGAAILAKEASASGSDWNAVADCYGEFARKCGFPSDETVRLLSLAWKWAHYRPSSWIEFCAEWIYVHNVESYCHLPSGQHVDGWEYLFLFEHLLGETTCPRMGVFNRCLVNVECLISDQSGLRGFRNVGGNIVFNAI